MSRQSRGVVRPTQTSGRAREPDLLVIIQLRLVIIATCGACRDYMRGAWRPPRPLIIPTRICERSVLSPEVCVSAARGQIGHLS